MKVLVINTGSSSIKYRLFLMDTQTVLAYGVVEKIGEPVGIHTYCGGEREKKRTGFIPNHAAGMEEVVDLLTDASSGVITDSEEIDAVGHRVVHGGETFKSPSLIDDAVLEAIRANVPLAPLHNPANITGIETARRMFPSAPQFAVFDTAFHQTIPPAAFLYAIPIELYKKYKVRRYGFHGTSHRYVAAEAAKMLGKPLEHTNSITIHLGNGGSIAAVKGGKSVDTSMGLTPLEGLVMGTRCGDLDPAIPYFLTRQAGMDMEEVNALLNKKSGLTGICGTNDMREVQRAVAENSASAKCAFDIYSYRIRKYIGAYTAVLNRVDAIVFTAGVGENSPETRRAVCNGMECFGIRLDEKRNSRCSKRARIVSAPSSAIAVLVIPTNEELIIARETARLARVRGRFKLQT